MVLCPKITGRSLKCSNQNGNEKLSGKESVECTK